MLCLVELPSPRHAGWSQEPARRNEQFVLTLTTDALRDPQWAMETVLHEAAHLRCAVLGVRDVRADGRYHTTRFAAAARGLGLRAYESLNPKDGWAITPMDLATTPRYRKYIERFAALGKDPR